MVKKQPCERVTFLPLWVILTNVLLRRPEPEPEPEPFLQKTQCRESRRKGMAPTRRELEEAHAHHLATYASTLQGLARSRMCCGGQKGLGKHSRQLQN